MKVDDPNAQKWMVQNDWKWTVQSMKVDGPNRIKEKGDSQLKVKVTIQRQTSTWMGLYVQGGLPVGYMG